MPPKGIKATSSPIQISAEVAEPSAGTFATETIELTLNVLDNEVFVVTQVNLDVDPPDLRTSSTNVAASISSTARTSVGGIQNTNVIASAANFIMTDGVAQGAAVSFAREDPLFAALETDYLAIVATNNMHLNIQGLDNANRKGVRARVYGYRAKADSSTYAALVQSELLSE
tara:strand:- start:377 stop:892 length:516 start_codon:yes stop_codon:yes gene_type:complete